MGSSGEALLSLLLCAWLLLLLLLCAWLLLLLLLLCAWLLLLLLCAWLLLLLLLCAWLLLLLLPHSLLLLLCSWLLPCWGWTRWLQAWAGAGASGHGVPEPSLHARRHGCSHLGAMRVRVWVGPRLRVVARVVVDSP